MFDNPKTDINTWWNHFNNVSKQQKIKAKTVLLAEGEISDTLYFIKKGCLRISLNNDGKEITFQFYFEGQLISSFDSFYKNEPSQYNIECLEPSIVESVSKKEFQAVIQNSPKMKQEFETYVFNRLIDYKNLFLSRIKDNPEKRYQSLLKHHPEILQRISQHYIASYLGITPVSLSRIRSRV